MNCIFNISSKLAKVNKSISIIQFWIILNINKSNSSFNNITIFKILFYMLLLTM